MRVSNNVQPLKPDLRQCKSAHSKHQKPQKFWKDGAEKPVDVKRIVF